MRIYNGCPEPALQQELDEDQRLLQRIREFVPEARCTYFPGRDNGYVVHVWGRNIGCHRLEKRAALLSALEDLKRQMRYIHSMTNLEIDNES